MNAVIYDLAIVLILLFFLWRGYRKGFVLTLCGFLAVFVALIGASFLSSALAEPVARAIEPAVTSSIHDQVTSYWQRVPEMGATSQDEDDWLAQLPLEELLEPLRESQFFKGYVETFQKAVDDRATEIVTHAVQALAHFVAVQIARTVIFVIAFFAVLVAWFFLSRTLDLITRLPVLNGLNRWSGAAVGLCQGGLVVFTAVWLFRDGLIPAEAVEHTWLLKWFAAAGPLSFFL